MAMWIAAENKYLIQGKFKADQAPTTPDIDPGKIECKERLIKATAEIYEMQRMLYAHDHHSVLLIFQAMDAAGKDSTIRHVFSGVNPAGFQVSSFKTPSAKELDHDFLWRCSKQLPERGRIGIFNRSYYEEVLVVRVHPEFLKAQRLSVNTSHAEFWQNRYESICDFEKHLVRNGTIVLKFWLNVSAQEQRKRFLDRLNTPRKNWKFNSRDVAEARMQKEYLQAYGDAIEATSKSHAPWYVIPADDKPFMRMTVAQIVVENLTKLKLHYPTVDPEEKANFAALRTELEAGHK